jgi:hypothetical protein
MTTDNFCFYLQNRLIRTGHTGGEQYSDTSPYSVPGCTVHCMVLFIVMLYDIMLNVAVL